MDELGQGPDLGAGKETDEATRFLKPFATHFSSQNGKSGALLGSTKFWMRFLFAAAPACKAAPSKVARWRCGTPSAHKSKTRGVDGQLSPGKRATPLRPFRSDDRQRHQKEPSPGCVPPQKSSTLHSGCQGRREDGHTGRYKTKEEEEDKDERREERERAPNQTVGQWNGENREG